MMKHKVSRALWVYDLTRQEWTLRIETYISHTPFRRTYVV